MNVPYATAPLIIRPYQNEAAEALFYYFNHEIKPDEPEANPIIALPTGTGKSIVIALIVQRLLQQYPGIRFIMSTHVKELIAQNHAKLLEAWPNAPVGIHSAGLGKRQTSEPIIFGGIKSMLNRVEFFGNRHILIIDECHLLSPDGETMYQSFIKALKKYNPYLRIIGFTATAYRQRQGSLADRGLFTKIVYDKTDRNGFLELVAQGWIKPPRAKQTATEIDVSNVPILKGDFNQTQLQEVADRYELNHKILQETCHYGQNRRAWLAFCSGIEHSEHVAEMLRNMFGIPAAAVHSKLDKGERDARIKDFKAGKLRCLTNNNILTTGFDHATIDFLPMLRPTTSTSLWVQMVGRGTRPCPGQEDCLVLDFARNTERLGPINDPLIPRRKEEGPPGEMPLKICEACGCYNHIQARVCEYCGEPFRIATKLTKTAGTAEILTGAPKVEKYAVSRVFYTKHFSKKDGTPCLRVTYNCQGKMFTEFVNIEHKGYAKHVAHDWWKQRHRLEPPDTVDQALSVVSELRSPRFIHVWVNKQPYKEVTNYEW